MQSLRLPVVGRGVLDTGCTGNDLDWTQQPQGVPTMRIKHALTTTAVLAAGTLAWAQNPPDRPNQPPTNPPPRTGQPDIKPGQRDKDMDRDDLKKIQLERASKIIGLNVKNDAGESLGEIKDLA